MSSKVGLGIAALAILGVAFAAGYLYRDAQPTRAQIVTADCSAAWDGSGTCMAGGIGYGIPVDVEWTDNMGSINEGSNPACLPPLSSATGLRVAVGFVWVGDVGTAHVFWIDCEGQPTQTPAETIP